MSHQLTLFFELTTELVAQNEEQKKQERTDEKKNTFRKLH